MQRRLTEIGWSAARTLYLLPARLMRSMRFLLDDVRIAGGSYIAPQAVIGRRTRINAASYVGPCVIGSYCAIGGRLVVRSGNHDTGFLNLQDHAQRRIIRSDHTVIGVSKGGVRIGHGVWIGDSVIILPGVQIGNGAVIGAGSVVTKSVPPYAIAAGNPARVLRHRFTPEALDLFKDLEWWTWDDSRLRANKWLFESDFSKPVDAATAERIRRLSENPDQ